MQSHPAAVGRSSFLDDRLRRDFPYRDGRVYLNSAGAGLPWAGAAAAAADHFGQIGRFGAQARPSWLERAESARSRLSRMLMIPAGDIAFLHSTTEILNLTATSFRWQRGDEIVYADDDFPTVVLPWGRAEATGARTRAVRIDEEVHRTEHLLDAITTRTRMVAVTHVNATTGTRVDLHRLGEACREVGALLVVDGIEALGAIPVDLELVDVYGAGVFKWLLSGFGTAVAVFRDRAREVLVPAHRGYGNPPPSTGFEYSEPNFPGLAVLDATLAYLEQVGWPVVYERVAEFTSLIAEAVTAQGLTIVTPAHRGGIIAFAHSDAAMIVERLADEGVDVVTKKGLVRASPHFYNTTEDIRRFGEALARAVAATAPG